MRYFFSLVGAASLLLAVPLSRAADQADFVYHGGTVLTIVDDRPSAEAVAVRGGRILAVGSEQEVLATVGSGTKKIDLSGRTLLPGFVDSHGHAYLIGLQASSANLLPPPDGTGRDIASVQALLTDWAANHAEFVEKVGWIVGFG
jgi:predicted amidohydrolase YtcJ